MASGKQHRSDQTLQVIELTQKTTGANLCLNAPFCIVIPAKAGIQVFSKGMDYSHVSSMLTEPRFRGNDSHLKVPRALVHVHLLHLI